MARLATPYALMSTPLEVPTAEVRNPKWDALDRLKSYVLKKNEALGFESSLACYAPGLTYSSKINAEDTWVCQTADDQATDTNTDVTNLAGVFTALSAAVRDAMTSLDEYVDEDDPAADWPLTR